MEPKDSMQFIWRNEEKLASEFSINNMEQKIEGVLFNQTYPKPTDIYNKKLSKRLTRHQKCIFFLCYFIGEKNVYPRPVLVFIWCWLCSPGRKLMERLFWWPQFCLFIPYLLKINDLCSTWDLRKLQRIIRMSPTPWTNQFSTKVIKECGSQQSSQLLLRDSNQSKIEDLESPKCIYVIYYVW